MQELSSLLAECLERASTQRGMQEAYTLLSVVLPSMWVSMGTNLAPVMASSIIDAGCIPLLVTVAKVGPHHIAYILPELLSLSLFNTAMATCAVIILCCS